MRCPFFLAGLVSLSITAADFAAGQGSEQEWLAVIPNPAPQAGTAFSRPGPTTGSARPKSGNPTTAGSAALSLQKNVNHLNILSPTNLSYTITLSNIGETPLTGVQVTDTLTNGGSPLVLAIGDDDSDAELDIGETWVYFTSYDVTQDDIDSGEDIINTASGMANEIVIPVQGQATTTITQIPLLTVDKSAEPVTYDLYWTIDYEVKVENVGNVTLHNVFLTDSLVDFIPADGAPLGVGEARYFYYDYVTTQADLDNGQITNNVTANSFEGSTDQDQAVIYAIVLPAINIEKKTEGQDADDEDGSDVPVLSPGSQVSWQYLVTNTGNVSFALTDVTVADSVAGVNPVLDGSSDIGTDSLLSPGETWTYTASGIVLDLANPLHSAVTVTGCNEASGAVPGSNAYQNEGTVAVPGASDSDLSHYCNTPVVVNEVFRDGFESGAGGAANMFP